jgi:holo-[acyl-carrier protein] synthase
MIKGVGIDIVDIGRIEKALERYPKMKAKLFTNDEALYCQSKNKPYLHYAVRFAAKEAIVKSLGTGIRGFSWKDISVSRDELGKPTANLINGAAKVANSQKIKKIELSLSFSKNQAVAVAVAEG